MFFYSDKTREADPHAAPDVEVFQGKDYDLDEPNSWFYWFCFPGCLPDSEPNGPFESKEAAIADARGM